MLLTVYLISSTEFHQILRLPLLMKHYTEHRSQVEDMTFWQFLVMHYETDVPHDDTDMRLPFKDCHHSVTNPFTAIPSQNIALNLPIISINEPIHFVTNSSFHSSYLDEIFQPPKIRA